MTVIRMDHVGIVVEDLDAALAFFLELGLTLDGRMPVNGEWVDRVVGIRGLEVEIAMLCTPDGKAAVELTRFVSPVGERGADDPARPQVMGLRNVMFAVTDVDATVERLRAHGGELIGEIAEYADAYRLCYARGPEGIIVALAQPLG